MTTIKCNTCEQEKDASEYYASSKNKCKACVLERQKELKAAKKGGAASSGRKTRSTSTKAKSSKKSKDTAEAKAADSRWEQPAGFGFAVELAVDENTRQTDVHLEQTTPGLGEQNIWLSQNEARSLRAWLDEKLGPV